jgi:hypothetical protein
MAIPGVVDHDVEAPVVRDDTVDQRRDGGGVRHIHPSRAGSLTHCRGRRACLRLVEVGQDDVTATGVQLARDRQPDAGRTSGDDRDLRAERHTGGHGLGKLPRVSSCWVAVRIDA